MLSRVAENLYWLSRYMERVANVARLLDDSFHLELDAAGLSNDESRSSFEGVLSILSCQDAFGTSNGEPSRESVLRFLTFDRSSSFSLLAMVGRARENARGTQETLSSEAWSHINQLYLYLNGPRAQKRFQADPFRLYERVRRGCVLFDGLIDSTMPRGEPYHFMQVGKYLERVEKVSRILNYKFGGLDEGGHGSDPSLHAVYWASLLRNCSAYEGYLQKQHNLISGESVVQYLVLEPDFPQAMRFCVASCLDSLRAISGGDAEDYGCEPERLLGRLDSEFRFTEVHEIFERGLPLFLDGVQQACNRIGNEISQAYFLT
jgi:uncharacterized alpha-E superfamily protein